MHERRMNAGDANLKKKILKVPLPPVGEGLYLPPSPKFSFADEGSK